VNSANSAPEKSATGAQRGSKETRAARPVRDLLLWRIPSGVVSVFIVGVLSYIATRVLPGDAASAVLGQFATEEKLEALRNELGLDKALIPGLASWLGDFFTGDFGNSLTTGGSVTGLVLPKLANSILLVVIVAVVSTLVGVAGGMMAGYRRDGLFDDFSSLVVLVASALPEFVVGVFVIFAFAVGVFEWFPAVSIVPADQQIWDQPDKLVLPALTLVIVTAPYMFRMVRASMIEALNSDYVEVAELKGVGVRGLLFRHALPNVVPPTVQVFGLNLLYLAGGIVLVETVFQFPGIGLAMADAVQNRDIPVLQFIVVLLAVFYVTLNILTDLVVLLSTPRRRAPR
jgi:peptide/nickel transport system permease protein